MSTIALPGLTGLAPPGANAPPDAGAPRGNATGTGVFAGVIAAAVAAASAAGDGAHTSDQPSLLDLAQLLSGLLPGAGEPGVTGADGTTGLTDALGLNRPDRLAGVDEHERTTLREAYEALMSALLIQAPVTTPEGVARTLDGTAFAASGAHPFAGTSSADGAIAIAPLLRGMPGGPDGFAGSPAGPADAAAAAAALASTSAGGEASGAAVAQAATAGVPAAPRGRSSLDIAALEADPGRAARPADTTERGTAAAESPFTARVERAVAETPAGASRSGAGVALPDAPGAARADAAGLPSSLAGTVDAGVTPAVRDVAGAEAPVPAARPAELVARLADTVQRATLSGDREVRLVLNPPELGHLTVRVQDTAQGVRIVIDASSAAARDLIQQHLPTLHSALEGRDVRVERLQVGHTEPSLAEQALNQNPGGSGFQGQSQQDQQQGDRPAWSPVAGLGRGGSGRHGSGTATVTATERARPRANVRTSGVDLLA